MYAYAYDRWGAACTRENPPSNPLAFKLNFNTKLCAATYRGLTEKQLRCNNLADLVSLLTKGLPPDAPAVYLVIDEATRLLDWKGAEPLLPTLMKLSELSRE